MAVSPLPIRRLSDKSGFSLMETMVAIVILSVGMLSLAALMSKMTGSTENSRYMSIAALLASEKLEDLNRLSSGDPELAVPSGSTSGGLSSDVCCITIGTETVDYYDQVYMSAGGSSSTQTGGITQTITSKNSGGVTVYGTYTHLPSGVVTTPPVDRNTWPTTAPTFGTDAAGTLMFKRRWVIEKDTPVVGTRRITVLVTMKPPTGGSDLNFRMSTVRQ